jgi:fatty acid desaturase
MTTAHTLAGLDLEAFARDLDAIKKDLEASYGPADAAHLAKMERWGRLCTGAGYATAWLGPNLVSATLLALGSSARWTMVMHHVSHKGYDAVPGVPERLTSKRFAQGARRFVDWLDFIDPEAWAFEHNVLHHYHTGETADPDLVEQNLEPVRRASWPKAWKYAAVAFFTSTWKISYYAPNTLQTLQEARSRRAARDKVAVGGTGGRTLWGAWSPLTSEGREFWRRCVLPYAGVRFGLIPALFAPLGPLAVANVAVNTAMAEVLHNIHSFLVIAPNHAGDDLHRYDGPAGGKAEFYLRQVMGSVDCTGGSDLADFLQGYLNYQIEHHLWPDLPMTAYRAAQPRVQAVCEKHGVPYVRESAFKRFAKLVDIMVGDASMIRGLGGDEAAVEAPAAAPAAAPA